MSTSLLYHHYCTCSVPLVPNQRQDHITITTWTAKWWMNDSLWASLRSMIVDFLLSSVVPTVTSLISASGTIIMSKKYCWKLRQPLQKLKRSNPTEAERTFRSESYLFTKAIVISRVSQESSFHIGSKRTPTQDQIDANPESYAQRASMFSNLPPITTMASFYAAAMAFHVRSVCTAFWMMMIRNSVEIHPTCFIHQFPRCWFKMNLSYNTHWIEWQLH
jgi:hypothetical protein